MTRKAEQSSHLYQIDHLAEVVLFLEQTQYQIHVESRRRQQVDYVHWTSKEVDPIHNSKQADTIGDYSHANSTVRQTTISFRLVQRPRLSIPSATERFLLCLLVCGTVFHRTSSLLHLSPPIALILNSISSLSLSYPNF